MNNKRQNGADVMAIIDSEIASGNLHAVCKAEAERESNGNYDLMISRYFLKRVSMLNEPEAVSSKLVDADERVKVAVNGSAGHRTKIVRYQHVQDDAATRMSKKKQHELCANIFGNLILILSSVSVISAMMILKGFTVQSMPYLFLFGVVLLCLVLPHLFSRVVFKKFSFPYQSYLKLMCIFMCMGSVASGIKLMKTNPENYAVQEERSTVVEPEAPVANEVQINISPVKSDSSVVNHMTF
ncbi:MAG: hypothetical protein ACSHX6_08580 [Akkermansiaceae bacterium]